MRIRFYTICLLLVVSCTATEKTAIIDVPTIPSESEVGCEKCEVICLELSNEFGRYKKQGYIINAKETVQDAFENSLAVFFAVQLSPQCSTGSSLVRVTDMNVKVDYSGFFWPILGWSMMASFDIEHYSAGELKVYKSESDYFGQARRDFSIPPLKEASNGILPVAIQQAACRAVAQVTATSTEKCTK